MEDTNLHFRRCATSLAEEFVLEEAGSRKTRLTRTTDITVSGPGAGAKALVMGAGMKCVQNYVFRNWARIVE